MGLDGGSLPNRREYLVKTRAEDHSSHGSEYRKHSQKLWTTCAISGKPLWEPIVACGKGQLYRKENVLKVLIKRKTRADEEQRSDSQSKRRKFERIPHIHGMKDFVTLKMELNPEKYQAAVAGEGICSRDDRAMESFWICPVTHKIANGITPFVFFLPCAHVLASECIRSNSKDEVPCPYCGQVGSFFAINPAVDVVETQKSRFQAFVKQANTKKIGWKG